MEAWDRDQHFQRTLIQIWFSHGYRDGDSLMGSRASQKLHHEVSLQLCAIDKYTHMTSPCATNLNFNFVNIVRYVIIREESNPIQQNYHACYLLRRKWQRSTSATHFLARQCDRRNSKILALACWSSYFPSLWQQYPFHSLTMRNSM